LGEIPLQKEIGLLYPRHGHLGMPLQIVIQASGPGLHGSYDDEMG